MSDIKKNIDVIEERMENAFECEYCGGNLKIEPFYCEECDQIICVHCASTHREWGHELGQPWL